MESKKINQLATELTPALSDLTIIGDPTTGISKKITLSQMASLFTGTVEEYANLAAFPLVGTADTIYIALDTNVLYRWDTTLTSYVELSPNIVTSLVFSDANGFDGNISLVGSVATLTITTALTQGSVPFIGASGALSQDNANLFFDDTNNRLGINTNTPTTALDVFGSGIIGRLNGTSTNNAFLGFASAGTNKWSIGNVQSDHRFRIYSEANTAELVSVLQTGEFGIGIANPTTKFHIDGGASALIANLDANVSVAKSISFRSDNSARINLEVSGTESGSNAGADLFIRRYSDAGALISTPLFIKRSSGDIGINTTSPNLAATNRTVLDINGTTESLLVFSSGGTYKSYIQNDGTNLILQGSVLKLQTAFTDILTIGSTGASVFSSTLSATDLFIGATATSASAKVYINATSGSSDFSNNATLFLNAGTANTTANLIRFNGALTKGLVFGRGINVDNFVWGFTDSTTPVMTLTDAGNLGLGTINPTAIVGYKGITLSGTDGSIVDFRYNNSAYGRVFTNSVTALGIESLSTTLPLVFKTQNGSGSTDRMTIYPNGNIVVGGITDNGNKLQINGDIYSEKQTGNAAFFMKRVTNSTNFEISAQETRTRIRTWSTANDRDIYFDTDNAGTTRMIITGGGRVAIGGNSGADIIRLEVWGANQSSSNYAQINYDSQGNPMFFVRNDGNINCGTRSVSPYNYSTTGRSLVSNSAGDIGYTSSTRESKKNIEDITDISWVNQLRPVSFNYRIKDSIKNEFTDEVYGDKSFGLIADEVEQVNADFVFYDIKEDGTKKLAGVKYESMTAILIKMVQELSAKVTALENK